MAKSSRPARATARPHLKIEMLKFTYLKTVSVLSLNMPHAIGITISPCMLAFFCCFLVFIGFPRKIFFELPILTKSLLDIEDLLDTEIK